MDNTKHLNLELMVIKKLFWSPTLHNFCNNNLKMQQYSADTVHWNALKKKVFKNVNTYIYTQVLVI